MGHLSIAGVCCQDPEWVISQSPGCVVKTLNGSSLNSRGVRSTPGNTTDEVSTLKGSPNLSDGALFQSADHHFEPAAGPVDTAVIDR